MEMEGSQKSRFPLIKLFEEISETKKELEETKQNLEKVQNQLQEALKKIQISERQTTMFRNKFKRIKRDRDAYL